MEEIYFYVDLPSNVVQEMRFEERMTLREWDALLAKGWRHNGTLFFCTSHDIEEMDQLCLVLPMRYRLRQFNFSKSQRKILRKNQDLKHVFRPVRIDDEKHALFFHHVEKFKSRQPASLWEFISPEPKSPFPTWELCVYDAQDKLVACSFFDLTSTSLSSTYAMYSLEEPQRSLGIYTMLLEIELAIIKKKRYYYPGYVYDRPSFYDYKKKFANAEFYDWLEQAWLPYVLSPNV